MGKSDWFAVLAGIIFLGVGSLMAALGERIMRIGGIALIAVGAVGLVVWFAYYRDAEAQGGNCNNYGPNGTINSSCNTTTIISPPRDANGLYQGDLKIGKVQGPTIDESSGIAAFQALVFNEFPDPTKPFEYGKLLLSCADFPRKQPNTFVGSLSASVVGAQCRIVGKTP
jgi:hypothetical protein